MKNRMKIKNTAKWLAWVVLPLGMLISCNEDQLQGMDDGVTETETIAMFSSSASAGDAAELEIDMVFTAQNQIDPSANSRTLDRFDACAAITRDTGKRVMTLEFGTEGCKGPDGRFRRGKIIVTFTGKINDRMSSRVITFDNYFVNRVQYMGQIDVLGLQNTNEGSLTSTRELRDFTMVHPDGNRVVMNGEMTREWIEGMGDGEPATNVVRLTGFKTERSTMGRAFREEIIEPIILDFGCHASGGMLRVAGVIEMTVSMPSQSNEPRIVRRIDFGDGTCDNDVTVTVNGRNRTVDFGD